MSSDWIEAVFSRSLDIFAKILPGLIVLSALAISLTSAEEAYQVISGLSSGEWFAVVAFAWVIGYAVQSFGEAICLIKYYPKFNDESCASNKTKRCTCGKYPGLSKWYSETAKFRTCSNYEKHKNGYYRLGVIKEVCGNVCAALIFAIVWVLFCGAVTCHFARDCLYDIVMDEWKILLSFALLTLFLGRMHCKHIDRQYKYLQASLSADSEEGQGEGDKCRGQQQ